MTASPFQLLALQGDLPGRLAAGDPDVVRPLAAFTGHSGAGLVLGEESRPLRYDPAALATALSVRLPRWPVLTVSDGAGDHPYNAARRFLSVDHLTGGRSGVVFRSRGSAPRHTAERISVIRALWNSWPIHSLVADRGTGIYAHTEGIRAIDHQGRDFAVYGALDSPTSIQGEPVSLWYVATAEELDAAHGLVDLVIIDDPALLGRWAASAQDERPGLVASGIAHDDEATAELVPLHSAYELAEAVAGIPTAERVDAAPSLRAVLCLPPRSYDLSSKPLAFGVQHA
ncbi:hypothetical protein [Arthrobacter sp. H-02-3]|uniref:hypothetical protein n=1 Tax=Arthrobacter sp. H-02-3 TaxID=2703675 RepID=UPI000DD26307|nr:hypothetical protein [Arthrobacter sp. H-02-3]PVZ53853.1 hypothetical protein C9424_16700 [Arthrobacter sp. H-02-3]